MVKNPEEYEYSSYSICILVTKKEKLISSERVLSYFKEDIKRELYRGFVEKSIKFKDGETVI